MPDDLSGHRAEPLDPVQLVLQVGAERRLHPGHPSVLGKPVARGVAGLVTAEVDRSGEATGA